MALAGLPHASSSGAQPEWGAATSDKRKCQRALGKGEHRVAGRGRKGSMFGAGAVGGLVQGTEQCTTGASQPVLRLRTSLSVNQQDGVPNSLIGFAESINHSNQKDCHSKQKH